MRRINATRDVKPRLSGKVHDNRGKIYRSKRDDTSENEYEDSAC